MCSPWTKLSNKTNVSSLNPFSYKIQIFKVRVKVSYFLRNLWKSLTIFHGRTMAMAAMNMVSTGGFSGVSFHSRRCPQAVASVLCEKIPIFGSRRSKLDHLTVWPHDLLPLIYLLPCWTLNQRSLFIYLFYWSWEDPVSEQDFEQARAFWRKVLKPDERKRVAERTAGHLIRAKEFIQVREGATLDHFRHTSKYTSSKTDWHKTLRISKVIQRLFYFIF
jgi:hypothetical protein